MIYAQGRIRTQRREREKRRKEVSEYERSGQTGTGGRLECCEGGIRMVEETKWRKV